MNVQTSAVTNPAQDLSDRVAPDCHGLNFFQIDRGLQDLLTIYLPADLRAHLMPHFERLGELAGNEIDDWARQADRHDPILHHRTPRGRLEDWIEFQSSLSRHGRCSIRRVRLCMHGS